MEGSYRPKAHQKSTKLPTPSSTDNYQTTGNLCEYCDYSFQINYHLRLHISLYHLHHGYLEWGTQHDRKGEGGDSLNGRGKHLEGMGQTL